MVEALYPFGSSLGYTVTSTKNFPFKIRVPGWAQGALRVPSLLMEEVLPCLIRHLKLHCKLLRDVKAKAGALINNRDDQLLAGTNNI